MGIGGLDKEFSDIFRRAFASRVFPPDLVEQMGEGLSCICTLLTFTKCYIVILMLMASSDIPGKTILALLSSSECFQTKWLQLYGAL